MYDSVDGCYACQLLTNRPELKGKEHLLKDALVYLKRGESTQAEIYQGLPGITLFPVPTRVSGTRDFESSRIEPGALAVQ